MAIEEEPEPTDLEIVTNSSKPEEVLENAERIMRDSEKAPSVRLRAELTYVQLGMINPLAMEFIEAAGIKEENNA